MAENEEKKENIKSDKTPIFDLELKIALISAVVGAVVGYASFLINMPALALGIAIVVLLALVGVMKKTVKSTKNLRWWFSNIAVIYILVWFIVWTIFFNTRIII